MGIHRHGPQLSGSTKCRELPNVNRMKRENSQFKKPSLHFSEFENSENCGYVHTFMCVHGHADAHARTNQRIILRVIIQKENSFAFLEK